MAISTVTDKGQTTVPLEVRNALKVKPRQRLEWVLQTDGTVVVRPQASALDYFAALKRSKRLRGTDGERKAMVDAVAKQAAKEGME